MIRTRYWEKGPGDGPGNDKAPALLLLHGGQPTGKGGGASALTWLRNFDGLSRQFHVYAIDRLGQGLTGNPKTQADYEHYYERVVDHAWGFVEAAGIDRVALVGHSQGGWPVTRMALDHPDRVSCVVNVDSVLAPGGEQNLNLHTARFYLHTIQFQPPEGRNRGKHAAYGRIPVHYAEQHCRYQRAARLCADAAWRNSKKPRPSCPRSRLNPRHPAAQALFEQAREDIAAGMLKVPSLVIWGFDDPSSPYPGGLALFELINATTPISELHAFNRSGHQSHIEYPEQFNQVVAGFCGRF